jgi:hypothetical protein
MSNYSSTIGRIAKPFNPMLVSIQVSLPTFGLEAELFVSHRAKHSNMSDLTRSTAMSLSKSVIIHRYQLVGLSPHIGIIMARRVFPHVTNEYEIRLIVYTLIG